MSNKEITKAEVVAKIKLLGGNNPRVAAYMITDIWRNNDGSIKNMDMLKWLYKNNAVDNASKEKINVAPDFFAADVVRKLFTFHFKETVPFHAGDCFMEFADGTLGFDLNATWRGFQDRTGMNRASMVMLPPNAERQKKWLEAMISVFQTELK